MGIIYRDSIIRDVTCSFKCLFFDVAVNSNGASQDFVNLGAD